MKTLIACFIAVALITPCVGQTVKDKDVPPAVSNAFKSKFPQYAAKEWAMEGSYYEAEFMMNSKEYEAAFDASGKWMETEHDIEIAAVPWAVKDGLSKNYNVWKIKEAVEIESPEYKVAYEIGLSKGKEKKSLIFTPDGKMVKEEKD